MPSLDAWLRARKRGKNIYGPMKIYDNKALYILCPIEQVSLFVCGVCVCGSGVKEFVSVRDTKNTAAVWSAIRGSRVNE